MRERIGTLILRSCEEIRNTFEPPQTSRYRNTGTQERESERTQSTKAKSRNAGTQDAGHKAISGTRAHLCFLTVQARVMTHRNGGGGIEGKGGGGKES